MWVDAMRQMLRGEWEAAEAQLAAAAGKKDGWGWGVNNGDIWLSQAAARAVLALQPVFAAPHDGGGGGGGEANATAARHGLAEAAALVDKADARTAGHPWTAHHRQWLGVLRPLVNPEEEEEGSEVQDLGAAALQAARSDALQSFIDGVRGQCEQAILQREARPRPALDVLPWDAWAAEEEPSIESVTCGVEGERRS